MPSVSLEFQREIALIRVDNPPVNALSSDVITGLVDAIEQFGRHPEARIAILYCAGRGFIAGADIREAPSLARSDAAARMINLIAGSPKPTMAAIHGYALGGGLETAIACDYRCVSAEASLGMPEVNIGAVPGYGGTQRLPRLIGLEKSLELVTTGKALNGRDALAAGLVDRMVDGSLLDDAISFARDLIGQDAPICKTDLRPVRDGDQVERLRAAALAAVARTRPGEDAPPLIVEATCNAATLPLDMGLAFERQVSVSRLQAPQSLAMRYLFFAERQIRNHPDWQSRAEECAGKMLETLFAEIQRPMASGPKLQDIQAAFRDFGWDLQSLEHRLPTAITAALDSRQPASRADGTILKKTPNDDVIMRCMAVLDSASRRLLREAPDLTPGAIDALFCQRFGFPRYRGGPLYFAGQAGRAAYAAANKHNISHEVIT